MGRSVIALGICGLGIAVGAFSLDVARTDAGNWFAGTSTAAGAAFLGAGWALIGCGAAFWARRPGNRFGPLVAAAGFGWFLLEWNNPGIASAVAFTVGLVLYATCPPLLAHAALSYPNGRLTTNLERGTIALAYIGGVVVLGLAPAILWDPRAESCNQCPANLVSAAALPDVAADLVRYGLYLGLIWAPALTVLVLIKLGRASAAARRGGWPVLLAGAAYLALVSAWFGVSLETGYLVSGTLERRLWLGQALALVGLAAGVAWSWIRGRRARAAVARVVVDLAQSPPPGGLREVLARIVGDPELVLAYPVGDADRLVDASGLPVELSAGTARTSLVRDGRPVAVLAHAPGVLDDEELVDEVTSAARLALENERLQAVVRARLEDLRASRARLVEAGDAERKRLERDLHDGAQQRLVGLSLSLRLVRSQLQSADPATAERLEEADAELRMATAELRELAHGLFPVELADEGLAAAVEALAENASVPLRIGALPEGRCTQPVETAAYAVVAGVTRAATTSLSVRARRSDGVLTVEVQTDSPGAGLDLVELEDRVRAIDGRFTVERGSNGRVKITAEFAVATEDAR